MLGGIFKVMYTLMYNALAKTNLYVPRMDRYSTIKYDQIVAYAAKAASIPENDMRATMDALLEAFDYFVTNGHSFKLDGVGTFSLSANTKTGDPEAEVCIEGADAIKRLHINFLPDKDLKNLCASLSINTDSENPENLRPYTDPVLRDVTLNGAKVIETGEVSGKGAYTHNANTLLVTGYNLPDIFTVNLFGKDANDREFVLNVRMASDKSRTLARITAAGVEGKLTSVQILGSTYEITGNPAVTDATTVRFGDFDVFEGAIVAAGEYPLIATGSGLTGAQLIVDGEIIPLERSTAKRLEANVMLSGSVAGDAHFIKIGTQEFNVIASTRSRFASIRTLTANGVSVENNATSPVLAGVKYRFAATGQALNGLTAEDIVTPDDAVVTNVSIAPERMTFDVVFGDIAEGASIKLGAYFKVNLTGGTPSQTVTSIGGAANGATIQLASGVQTLPYVASAALTAAQIRTEGGVSLNSVAANNMSVAVSGNGVLRVYDAENAQLTLFTLRIEMTGQQTDTHTVTLTANPSAGGDVYFNDDAASKAATVEKVCNDGASVFINAAEKEGYEFVRWNGDGLIGDSTSKRLEISVSGDMNITAQFAEM